MALSNWATIAWNENGEPCPGEIEADGTVIDIYKNWLYVHDEKAWKENSGFGRYTIMEITEGHLRYNRLKIVAKRGKHDEIFVAVEYNGGIGCYAGKAKGIGNEIRKEEKEDKKQLIGIGCYAYEGHDYVGVSEGAKKEFFDWIKESKETWGYSIDIDLGKIKDFKIFNQGDVVLAKEFGIDTPVNTDEPILSKMLKGIKDEYPYGECPDCHEPIPDHITEGGECQNCGHVFVSSQ
jgi:hypothetical protein